MTDRDRARAARIRVEASRRHLDEAMRALSVPEPDWVAARVALDMAADVMPAIREARHGDR